MIENLHKNIMGTTSFSGRFGKMRKVEEFDVYPIPAQMDGHPMQNARIQSDKRSGFINVQSGFVTILEGQYFTGAVKYTDQLNGEELLLFRAAVAGTASAKAGKKENGVVHCDNAGAVDVLMVCGDASHARE